MAGGDDGKNGLQHSDLDGGVVLTEDQKRQRRARNLAIAGVLFGLVVLFYLVTVFKMGGNVAHRPM